MRIFFTGDFFYNYDYLSDDYTSIISELENYYKVFINYEGSFDGLKSMKKNIYLTMTDQSLELPKNVSLILCNNHSTDFGESGIRNTMQKMNSHGIDYFGLNKNINDISYYKNYIIKDKKIFIATLGWANEECVPANKRSPGVKPFNSKSISDLKNTICDLNGHFKILYIHAGYEWEKYPLPDHVGLAREAIDSGFDMVYFCHSHTVQEYEFYNEKLIHYGLGNFYFSSMRDSYPVMADNGVCLILDLNHEEIEYSYRDIYYDRSSKKSFISCEKKLEKKDLIYKNLSLYSKNYKKFRTRKKNPRPILYYKKNINNYLKFLLWKLVVDLLGMIKMRSIVKNLLGWN